MSDSLADPAYRQNLKSLYRDTLLHDVMPFWLKHGMDRGKVPARQSVCPAIVFPSTA